MATSPSPNSGNFPKYQALLFFAGRLVTTILIGPSDVAGLQQPEVIDLVAKDENGAALLIIIEASPWSTPLEQAEQLKAKLNTYAQFILDGGMISRYPELENIQATIRLDCSDEPPELIQGILRAASHRLSRNKIGVTYRVDSRL